MAASGTVGILRALLTADASAYAATMKKSADTTKAFGSSVAAAGATAARVSPQLTRLEKSFQGDKLLYSANNLVKAITNIGGATKLTAAEQARANRTLNEAIDKYKALGQQAPKAMRDLEKATSQAAAPTKFLETKMVALGTAVGMFASQVAMQAVRALGNFALEAFETAGQISDLAKQTGLSTDSIQEMQAVADQTGQSLDTFTNAAFKLGVAIAGRGPSVVNALRDLGLSWEAVQGLSMDEQFRTVMTAAGAMASETERNGALVELFGAKVGKAMAGVADDYAEIADAAAKSSRAQIDALDRAGDAWAAFVTRTKTQVRSFMGERVLFFEQLSKVIEEGGVFQRWSTAVDEANRRVQALLNAPLPAAKPADPVALTNYVEQLRAAQKELANLDAAERKQIQAAQELGAGTEEITDLLVRYGVSAANAEGVLRLLTDQTKDHEAATKKAAEAQRLQLAAVDKTRSALEALGLTTRVSVIASYEEFADMQHLALAEGVKLDAFLIAMLPTLNKLAEETRRSGVEPLAELTAALNAARAAALRAMPVFDQVIPQFLSGMGEQIARTAEEIAQLNAQLPISPEVWTRGKANEGLKAFGVRTREEQAKFVEETRKMWAAIVHTYGEGSREATKVLAEMTDEQLTIIGRLPTYWQKVIVPTIGEALGSISQSFTSTFGQMLVKLTTWKDGFIAIWNSIKQAVARILADILQNFIEGFLKKLLAQMASQRVANAVGGLFGGGGGGGGGLGQGVGLLGGLFSGGGAGVAGGAGTLAGGAVPGFAATGMAGLPGAAAGGAAGTAAGTTAAGVGGLGPAFVALASNPVTWIAAAGILLAWGIGKKGWFRGGEEALHVSPARDRFFSRFGPPGTGEGSGFQNLAAILTGLTGESGGGRLFRALTSADTAREFNAAVTSISTLLQRRGVPLPADPNAPRQRFPTRHEGGLIPGASEVLVRALAGEGVLSHRGLRTIGGPSALNAANAGNPMPALAGSLAHAGAGGSTILPASLAGVTGFGAAAPPSVNLNMTIQAWDRADLNDAFRDEIIPRLRDALQFNQQGILTTMKSSLGR